MNLDHRIKFRHLLCFLELARQRSFAKAADAVAVSQPAISKTLKELEDIVATRLFERSSAGVSLTPAGETFLRYAGPCVQALRDGVNSLRDHDPQGGLVRVGALSTVESHFLPQVIQRMQQRHAATVIRVATGSSAQLLSQLKVGELDLVVGRMTDSPQIHGLTFEHLYSESMTLVVRPRHPLLDDPEHCLQRCAHYPVVLPLPGTTLRQYVDSFCIQWGLSLHGQRLETLSSALARRYTMGSDAVWIAPQDSVWADLEEGQLVELPLGTRESGGSIGISTSHALGLPLAAQWFCDVLREVAAGAS